MASMRDTATFFTEGTASQFQHVLSLYPQVLRLKAESRNRRPEDLIKLDNWYQNELPKKIQSRGRDAHCSHEELVQLMKWKQARGKNFPQLNYLVKVNTPRAVMNETKKAFKKLPNLEQAITALNNLKGVGTTMASAILAAAAPDIAPFMADECLLAIPEIEGIDYTTKEYLNFVWHIQNTADRLSKESNEAWTLHSIELALWTHFVASELKPELLDGIPCANGSAAVKISHQNGDVSSTASKSSESADSGKTLDNPDNTEDTGNAASSNDGRDDVSINEDSLDQTPITNDDEVTNDSVITSDSATNDSVDIDNKQNNDIVLNINEETCSSFLEPPSKKVKLQESNSSDATKIQDSESSSVEEK
ncbi:hypothetical protein V9T40_012503 [Parthenolecanium corni]|uniref:Uncharacterized protein n=1 Tax=Parthenolecanium corni TaxID=536013 RepID=A0AAN9T7B9_9HEMI